MEVANGVVTDSVIAIANFHGDVHAIGAMKIVELVGVANHEANFTIFWIWRPLFEEHLHISEYHAGEGWRFAPHESQFEAELRCVEVDRGRNIRDGKSSSCLVALDKRSGRSSHESSLPSRG